MNAMISAFIILNCHFPFDARITKEISQLQSVTNVYRTEGRYELIIKVSVESEAKLNEMISSEINTVPGVDSSLALIIA